MATEPGAGAGDNAVGRHRRSPYWLGRVEAGKATFVVATVLAATSVGLLVAASWHSVMWPDDRTVTRDVAAPWPVYSIYPSSPPTETAQASPSASASASPTATARVRPTASTTSTPRPTATGRASVSYEAESRDADRSPGTRLRRVRAASGGRVVGYLGRGETLRFAVDAQATGRYAVTIYYIAGETRAATVRVNGGRAVWGVPPPTPDWYTVGSVTIPVDLAAGRNTIEFGNPRGFAPDIDRIVVG